MSSLDFILGLASGLGAAVGLAIVVWFLFLREPADRSPSDPPAGMFPEEPMAASVDRAVTPLPRFPSE
ncbi:MAG TPA: hypothetical protein VGV64_07995, partial [Thermoplasmata archaeon]|nr:hypothetical protein [Thermoplasmata archaeon]